MNLDEIKRILQMMEENKLVEFEYEEEGRKLKLRRSDEHAVPPPVSIAMPTAMSMALPAAAPQAAPAAGEPAAPSNLFEFKSPLVGTFYRSSKPDADPFVNVGDEVNPEKILCIIEAMKVMNEIKAEMTGVVREVLVKNGQAVEFGETLFQIEKK